MKYRPVSVANHSPASSSNSWCWGYVRCSQNGRIKRGGASVRHSSSPLVILSKEDANIKFEMYSRFLCLRNVYEYTSYELMNMYDTRTYVEYTKNYAPEYNIFGSKLFHLGAVLFRTRYDLWLDWKWCDREYVSFICHIPQRSRSFRPGVLWAGSGLVGLSWFGLDCRVRRCILSNITSIYLAWGVTPICANTRGAVS